MTFVENFPSHINGPPKHYCRGALVVGVTFLVSSFCNDTTELLLAVATLGSVALYITLEKYDVPGRDGWIVRKKIICNTSWPL